LSTAGISLLLAGTPHRFTGLTTIGKLFFILSIVLYAIALALIAVRFTTYPKSLWCSLMHPHESLFFPTVLLTCKLPHLSYQSARHQVNVLQVASILACAQIYGSPYCGPWFPTAMRVTLWLYVSLAFTSAVLQYLHLFSAPARRLTIQSMTPAWILPIFPILLGGLLASIVAPDQPLAGSWTMVVGGLTLLGMGWMIAFLIYAIYLYRLMSFGLPAPNLRPGMFIAVGPPAFTGLALINLGAALSRLTEHGYFAGGEKEGAIVALRVLADFAAIFLWAFAFWFFCVSLVAGVLGVRGMSFHLVWWALVFPNIALALVTGRIGERLESRGIMGVASAMAVLLVAAWLFVAVLNVRAVVVRQIMMPGKDEDKGMCKCGVLLVVTDVQQNATRMATRRERTECPTMSRRSRCFDLRQFDTSVSGSDQLHKRQHVRGQGQTTRRLLCKNDVSNRLHAVMKLA
jgi:C4-dicarboxylate transporter/malic acid transport protein